MGRNHSMLPLPNPIDTELDEYRPPKRNKKALALLGVRGTISASNPMKNKLVVPVKQPQLNAITSHSESMKDQHEFEFVDEGYEKYLDEHDDEPMPEHEDEISQSALDFQLRLSNIDSEHEMKTSSMRVTAFEFDVPAGMRTHHPKNEDNASMNLDVKSDQSARTVTPVHVDSMLEVFTKFGFLQRENINSVRQLNQYHQKQLLKKAAMAKSSPMSPKMKLKNIK